MRHVVAGVLLLLSGCGGGSEGRNKSTESSRLWLGRPIPFVAAMTVKKVQWLKKAGSFAEPIVLGPSYRLDETTPYVQGRGELYDVYSLDTSHFWGGFASLRTRLTVEDFGTLTPGIILHVKTDPTHHQLFDCHIVADGWQMEFQTAADWVWSKAPLSTVSVTVQSNHAFFVLPKDATKDWAFVRIMATLQNPVDQFWRFVGCDISPIS